jgi:uncharacterized RDD family membrane protein YckC
MVRFEYPSAEMGSENEVIGKRIVAFALDVLLVIAGIVAVVSLIETVEPPHPVDLQRLFGVVIGFGYFIYLEGEYGQTVGKRLMDIVIVTEDGEPINYPKAAGRTFLRLVDWIFFVGLVSILVTDCHQRPGDMSTDTVVLRALEPTDSTDA